MQQKIPYWLIGASVGIAYFAITFLIEFTFRCKFVWEFTGHCAEIYSPFAILNFPASIGMFFVAPNLLKFGTFTQVMLYYCIADIVIGVLVCLVISKIRKNHL